VKALYVSEYCWDNNTIDGDGCSSFNKVEGGWYCREDTYECQPIHGDAYIVGPEQCEDNNTVSLDGCDNDGDISVGFSCGGVIFTCTVVHGDGIIAGNERCDTGHGSPVGCEQGQIAQGYQCKGIPSVCTPIPISPTAFCDGLESIWQLWSPISN